MYSIFRKEVNSFFYSPTGYLVVGLFLVVNSLFLWVFEGPYNILDGGFANLSSFFTLAPWIFLFLIPAITMKSFSEEVRQGTLELLFTRPLSSWQLVLGKYFGILTLVILSLLPTLLYGLTLYYLKEPGATLDTGVMAGSYLGLLFLGGCYAALGIYASVLSPNQIVSFTLGILFCFICYFAFSAFGDIRFLSSGAFGMEDLGISAHYDSISRGIIDTRDVIYFLSFILCFLTLTRFTLNKRKLARS